MLSFSLAITSQLQAVTRGLRASWTEVAYARKCQLVSTPEKPASQTCAAAVSPEFRDGPERDFGTAAGSHIYE